MAAAAKTSNAAAAAMAVAAKSSTMAAAAATAIWALQYKWAAIENVVLLYCTCTYIVPLASIQGCFFFVEIGENTEKICVLQKKKKFCLAAIKYLNKKTK